MTIGDKMQGSEEDPGSEKVGRAERKAQSRQQILKAARDVFFRDGFMAANLDEVAESALFFFLFSFLQILPILLLSWNWPRAPSSRTQLQKRHARAAAPSLRRYSPSLPLQSAATIRSCPA